MKLYGIATKIRQVEGHGSYDEFLAIKPVFIDRKEQIPPFFYSNEEAAQFIRDNNLNCKVIEVEAKHPWLDLRFNSKNEEPYKPFDGLVLTREQLSFAMKESRKEGIPVIEYIYKNKDKVTINYKKE